MRNGLYTLGITWSAVYLLDSSRPVLFEAGFTCAGEMYARAIRSVLKNRTPELLFLTHVHWDHSGAAGQLKEAFPTLRIAASARAAEIMKRPNARKLMTDLNRKLAPLVASLPGVNGAQLLPETFRPFEVEMTVADGQSIEVERELTVQVLATPGHTRDHVSYYIPEKQILIATEACGCMDRTGRINTEFLVDYDAYVSSLTRLAALPVKVLCQGHHFVFVGQDEVRRFFSRSITEAARFRDRVYELLEAESGSAESVMRRIKAEQYDSNRGVKQMEAAYLLSLRARITHLAEKWKEGGGQNPRMPFSCHEGEAPRAGSTVRGSRGRGRREPR